MEKIQQVSDTTKNTKLYVLESGKCYEAKKKKVMQGKKNSGQWVVGMWGHIAKNMKRWSG